MSDSLIEKAKAAKIPFGKFKGTPLEDIPYSYIGWLRNQPSHGFALALEVFYKAHKGEITEEVAADQARFEAAQKAKQEQESEFEDVPVSDEEQAAALAGPSFEEDDIPF